MTVDQFKQYTVDAYYNGQDGLTVLLEELPEGFFDFNNGIAGELLQHLSNFRIKVAIVGDTSGFTTASQQAYLAETARSSAIRFFANYQAATEWIRL